MRLHLILLASLLILVASPHAVEGQAPDETQSPRAELVRQLDSTASAGGRDRAFAIGALARIGSWSEVDHWLATYSTIKENDKLAEAAELIGKDTLLRISLHDGLTDGGRAGLDKILQGTDDFLHDRQRLSAALKQLAGDSVDETLSARRTLISGGNASIEILLEAIGQGIQGNQYNQAVGLLKSFGEQSVNAADQLSTYGSETVRGNVLRVLQRLSSEAAVNNSLSAAFAVDASDSETQVARALIGNGITRDLARQQLVRALNTAQQIADNTPRDLKPAMLWSVNAQRSAVTEAASTEFFLRYRNVYDAAQRLRRIGELPISDQRQVLACDLAYRLIADPQWGDPDQIKTVQGLYPGQLTTKNLLAVMSQAKDNMPAVLGILRLLQNTIDPANPRDYLVQESGGGSSALVDLVSNAYPIIRFEAAALIHQVLEQSPEFSFPRQSFYRKTLSEMSALTEKPIAIVLETRPQVISIEESILAEMGYHVKSASSMTQLEKLVGQGGDIRLIVCKLAPPDGSSIEAVDRTRRLPEGRLASVIIFHDDTSPQKSIDRVQWQLNENRWQAKDAAGVYLMDLPGSGAAYYPVLTDQVSFRRVPAMTEVQRKVFQRLGTDALQGAQSTP
ncbi:MAG: hypothetical protein CBB71_04025 [Rhodopirellula sp. TMED11]|nr:MAG: hypothetical protein CBB71_04025 [Rhodopirellula sp. TMED11]